jgi:hypothetical protein
MQRRAMHPDPGGDLDNISPCQHSPDRVQALLDNRQDNQCQLPEATRLASTIQTWWPAVLTALLADRQRPHRRVQPNHQTGQTRRLRLPQHGQLPAPYPQPHRGHPTAKISSMNGSHPAEVVEPLVAATGVGLADKPRRRWYARDDLGVVPFVVRTGVN